MMLRYLDEREEARLHISKIVNNWIQCFTERRDIKVPFHLNSFKHDQSQGVHTQKIAWHEYALVAQALVSISFLFSFNWK